MLSYCFSYKKLLLLLYADRPVIPSKTGQMSWPVYNFTRGQHFLTFRVKLLNSLGFLVARIFWPVWPARAVRVMRFCSCAVRQNCNPLAVHIFKTVQVKQNSRSIVKKIGRALQLDRITRPASTLRKFIK